MTKPYSSWTAKLSVVGSLCLVIVILLDQGCSKPKPRRPSTSGAQQSKSKDSAFLVDTIAKGFNDLPSEVILDLQPPEPILDDSKSSDGQPVLATLGKTPAVPDGPYNYLFIPKGNSFFRRLNVGPGDIVRYFILRDEESREHGIEQIKYIELIVRRLDVNNPESALIIEGGLNGPVDYPTRIEIWRFSDKRMNEIRRRVGKYAQEPTTLQSWEPSPDESALIQLQERANQWLRNRTADNDTWQPEPLVKELPPAVRQSMADLLSEKSIAQGSFSMNEMRQMQQAIWARDISRWAKQEAVSPVEVATALFDWTVRNIQLTPPDELSYAFQPWQVLMYGFGSAEQRAWIFAELCRQQQLDVVMLSVGDRWWLPALLHEGQLYLFDTRLGLPIPGIEPGNVATLDELIANPELIRNLDVGEDLQYNIAADDLENIAAELVSTPLQLAKRSWVLERALEGEDYVVLSSSTGRLAEALKKLSNINKVQLWSQPFELMLAESKVTRTQRVLAARRFLVFSSRPRLWKARALHFQGTKDIPLADRNDPLAQPDYGHQQATALYQDPRIRPPKKLLDKLDSTKRTIYQRAKQDASYWLGLLSYDLGKYKVAQNWLANLTLAANPDGPWTQSASYNLARTLEAMGDLPGAIKLLKSDDSPQRHGNLLRARMLEKRIEAEQDVEN